MFHFFKSRAVSAAPQPSVDAEIYDDPHLAVLLESSGDVARHRGRWRQPLPAVPEVIEKVLLAARSVV